MGFFRERERKWVRRREKDLCVGGKQMGVNDNGDDGVRVCKGSNRRKLSLNELSNCTLK